MDDTPKPWWIPDLQSFLAFAIVILAASALYLRMARTSTVDDKLLEMMVTVLFTTCLVTVYNYSFGSSRGSQAKDETQNKIVEKLAGTGTGNGSSVAVIEAATAAAKGAAPPAAQVAAPPAAEIAVDHALDERGIANPNERKDQ